MMTDKTKVLIQEFKCNFPDNVLLEKIFGHQKWTKNKSSAEENDTFLRAKSISGKKINAGSSGE